MFWGLGIGDWGLGIGPIPNPRKLDFNYYFRKNILYFKLIIIHN